MTPTQRTIFEGLVHLHLRRKTLRSAIGCTALELDEALRTRRNLKQAQACMAREKARRAPRVDPFLAALRKLPPPADCSAPLGIPVMIRIAA
jgi:hypothetical protein